MLSIPWATLDTLMKCIYLIFEKHRKTVPYYLVSGSTCQKSPGPYFRTRITESILVTSRSENQFLVELGSKCSSFSKILFSQTEMKVSPWSCRFSFACTHKNLIITICQWIVKHSKFSDHIWHLFAFSCSFKMAWGAKGVGWWNGVNKGLGETSDFKKILQNLFFRFLGLQPLMTDPGCEASPILSKSKICY